MKYNFMSRALRYLKNYFRLIYLNFFFFNKYLMCGMMYHKVNTMYSTLGHHPRSIKSNYFTENDLDNGRNETQTTPRQFVVPPFFEILSSKLG